MYLCFMFKTGCIKIILLFSLLVINSSIYSKELDGYIITKEGEKIDGLIRVSSLGYDGAIYINNINYVPMYVSVFFKATNTKRYKEYFASDINGFSFYYQEQQIYFFSIEHPCMEWGKLKLCKEFLRLVVNGSLKLFDKKTLVRYGNNYTEITDYFILDQNNNVSNAADNDYADLESYLVNGLKIEKEFIRNQPFKINIRNLALLIKNYNSWILGNERF